MNKLVKGSIAGAAGIALLLGGAGTFALWNDSVTVAAGTVTTGELRIADATTPAAAWTEQSLTGTRNGVAGTVIVPSTTLKMVPGDTWRYTRTITLTTTGKNLLADLTFDPASVVSGLPTGEFEYAFTAAPVAATGAATVAETAAGSNVWRVTPGTAATTNFTVTLDVTFKDITTTAGNVVAGQNVAAAINAGALKFTLKQVRP